MLALLLLILGIQYTTLQSILGILGGILGILGYFGDFFSGILVYHYPPWPTLKDVLDEKNEWLKFGDKVKEPHYDDEVG